MERFGRKPAEGWKFRITGKLRVHKIVDQKDWEPRKLGIRSKALTKAGHDPRWGQRPDELGIQHFRSACKSQLMSNFSNIYEEQISLMLMAQSLSLCVGCAMEG